MRNFHPLMPTMASFLFPFFPALLFTPSFSLQLRDVNAGSVPPLPSFGHHLSSALTSLGYTQLVSAIPSFSDFSILCLEPPRHGLRFCERLYRRFHLPHQRAHRPWQLHLSVPLQAEAAQRPRHHKTRPVLRLYSPGQHHHHGRHSCELSPHRGTRHVQRRFPRCPWDSSPNCPTPASSFYSPLTETIPNTTATADDASRSKEGDLPTPIAEMDMPFPLETYAQPKTKSVVSLMLRYAILSLRENGNSILALAMRIRYPDLVRLQNMAVFALDDGAIFSGCHAYVNNVRFQIVPNRFLTHADLIAMPLGTVLPTLARGERIVVTSTGDGVRINYVPIRSPDVLVNRHVVVHGVFLPFPSLPSPHLLHPFPSGGAAFQAPSAAPQEEVPRDGPFPGPNPSPSDFLEDDVL